MADPHRMPSSIPPAAATSPMRRVTVVATHTDPPHGPFPLPFVTDPDSTVAAAFRVLRHRLRRQGDAKIIAITSPNAREGKTTCAANLAMAIAEHGRERVMLAEANLRTPRLGEALGFSPPVCFAHQMMAHLERPHAPWEVVAAYFDNLHVMAVAPSTAGTMLLNAPAFRRAIEGIIDSGYTYVVIDCPHALGRADVNIIEDSADGVLLTGMAGSTTGQSLRRTADHLAPARILGVTLMNTR